MAQSVLAQDAIEIHLAVTGQATPIVGRSFRLAGRSPLPEDLGEQITSTICVTLACSRPFDRSNMLSNPTSTKRDIYARTGASRPSSMCSGQVNQRIRPQNRLISATVFTVGARRSVDAPRPSAVLRRSAAIWRITLSEEIFEEITGIRGAFNTKLLYVAAKRFSEGIRVHLQRSDL